MLMQTPLVFRAILGLLMDLAIPASLGAFVMAGMRLRSEGGMNFEASGGFLEMAVLGLFLAESSRSEPLAGAMKSVPGAPQLMIAGATGAQYTAGIERVTNDFVNDFLVGHVVPVVAASLVFKAILDLSQGYSPLASIIAALFLLGVQGFYNLATGSWMQSGDAYGVTDMLMSMFGYAANRISPIVGGLALSGSDSESRAASAMGRPRGERPCIPERDRDLGVGHAFRGGQAYEADMQLEVCWRDPALAGEAISATTRLRFPLVHLHGSERNAATIRPDLPPIELPDVACSNPTVPKLCLGLCTNEETAMNCRLSAASLVFVVEGCLLVLFLLPSRSFRDRQAALCDLPLRRSA